MRQFIVATWDSMDGAMDIKVVVATDALKAIQKVHPWTEEFNSAEEAMSALFDSDQGIGVLEI